MTNDSRSCISTAVEKLCENAFWCSELLTAKLILLLLILAKYDHLRVESLPALKDFTPPRPRQLFANLNESDAKEGEIERKVGHCFHFGNDFDGEQKEKRIMYLKLR